MTVRLFLRHGAAMTPEYVLLTFVGHLSDGPRRRRFGPNNHQLRSPKVGGVLFLRKPVSLRSAMDWRSDVVECGLAGRVHRQCGYL